METIKNIIIAVIAVVAIYVLYMVINFLKEAAKTGKDVVTNPFGPLVDKVRDATRTPAKVVYGEGERGRIQKDYLSGKLTYSQAQAQLTANAKISNGVKPNDYVIPRGGERYASNQRGSTGKW